eukprot:tig00021276_g19891.t1
MRSSSLTALQGPSSANVALSIQLQAPLNHVPASGLGFMYAPAQPAPSSSPYAEPKSPPGHALAAARMHMRRVSAESSASSMRSASPDPGAGPWSRSGSLDVSGFPARPHSFSTAPEAHLQQQCPPGPHGAGPHPANWPAPSANWPNVWSEAQYGGLQLGGMPQPPPGRADSPAPSAMSAASERTAATVPAVPVPFIRMPPPGPRPRSNSTPFALSPLWTTSPDAYCYKARQDAITRRLDSLEQSGVRRRSITSLGPHASSPLCVSPVPGARVGVGAGAGAPVLTIDDPMMDDDQPAPSPRSRDAK